MAFYASDRVVKVIDSGLGITADELPHLFERFDRGHSILQKLEVRDDRTQAAVLAIQKGLVAEELLAIEP
jgi:signal transduction histidine kinase